MMNTNIRVFNTKGFTLIELLAVIAIIGILSSVIITSLSTARAKARDAQRLSQMKQIKNGLELYRDTHLTYPSTTPTGFTGEDAAIQYIAAESEGNSFLNSAPIPLPGGGATYIYRGIQSDGSECDSDGQICTSFALGIQIERSENPVLLDDADFAIAPTYDGGTSDCIASSVGDEQCYDIKP